MQISHFYFIANWHASHSAIGFRMLLSVWPLVTVSVPHPSLTISVIERRHAITKMQNNFILKWNRFNEFFYFHLKRKAHLKQSHSHCCRRIFSLWKCEQSRDAHIIQRIELTILSHNINIIVEWCSVSQWVHSSRISSPVRYINHRQY